MHDIKTKINDLVCEYEEVLFRNGIKLHIYKKYFEAEVDERFGSHGEGQQLINLVDKALDKKREKKYNYERNRYHCIILTAVPADGSLNRNLCRDYAFVLKKVERAHIGDKPIKYSYEEKKVLSKIEKRIQWLIKKSKNKDAKSVCKDNILDLLRYFMQNKYKYKRKILGRNVDSFELLFIVIFGILALLAIIFLWLMST